MKNIVFFLLLLCVTTLSCEDFLEVEPDFGVSVNSYYTTEAEADVALTSCYDNISAQFDRLYGLGIDAIGIYAGDLAISGRTNPRDYSALENNTQTGTEEAIFFTWKEAYAGIYRCNLFLEKVEGIEMDEATKQVMIAQAKFLRAYYYFELVKTFGGVPLTTQTLSTNELNLPRSSREEVIAQIIQDMTESIDPLPLKSQWGASNAGRISKGTAQAYLTKVLLYEGRWEEAATMGANVVNSGEYALHDDYFDNFRISQENGVESIFEVQCISGTTTGEGNAHYDLESFDDTPNPRGYTAPRREYSDSFGLNADGVEDPRKDLTMSFNIISTTLFGSVKYVQPQEPQPARQFDGDLNYVLMRYADFLLLYAEALNEVGRTEEALGLINQVRQRPSVNMAPLSGLTQQETRRAIYDERKWELGLEGHRFFDLVRWGIAGEVIRGQGRRFEDGVHELMPIPITELDLNPQLTQNPGY